MLRTRIAVSVAAAAAGLAVLTACSGAETAQPVIAPAAAGGTGDFSTRTLVKGLSDSTGWTIVVDNRPGGLAAIEAVVKAPPDGYTLLVISIAHAVDPFIYKEPYDPIKDFVPVAILATGTNVLTVNPTVPVHSVKELLDLAKAKPAFLNYASAGLGSFQNLSGELFKAMAGVDIVHVPYKGGGPSMLAVIAGEAQLMFSSIVQTVPNIQSGRLRALATGGAKRSPILPELPTVGEAGVPGYVAADWWGILAPAGTPAPIVNKLHGAIEEVLNSDDTKKNLDQQGATPLHMSTAEFGGYIKAEMTKWGPVVTQAGIKAE